MIYPFAKQLFMQMLRTAQPCEVVKIEIATEGETPRFLLSNNFYFTVAAKAKIIKRYFPPIRVTMQLPRDRDAPVYNIYFNN